ncbi:MAG: hypothetical protein PHQ43_04470 [Dehalococcoidales bacterium]|nr:hypothetical protein [Dehalococcoidales bacterium]
MFLEKRAHNGPCGCRFQRASRPAAYEGEYFSHPALTATRWAIWPPPITLRQRWKKKRSLPPRDVRAIFSGHEGTLPLNNSWAHLKPDNMPLHRVSGFGVRLAMTCNPGTIPFHPQQVLLNYKFTSENGWPAISALQSISRRSAPQNTNPWEVFRQLLLTNGT